MKLATVPLHGLDFVRDPSLDHPAFPEGFFDRVDPSDDMGFYDSPRLVTHIDGAAIEAVGRTHHDLRIDGEVLDLMSSWISHFLAPPRRLVGLGLNAAELRANRLLAEWVVHDLNRQPVLPFDDASFDDVVCCVSVDYLTRPVEVFADVARVLRPGGRCVITFSDRCFPAKAIRGWLSTDDAGHIEIVREYLRLTGQFEAAHDELRTDPSNQGDPLYAVWAVRRT